VWKGTKNLGLIDAEICRPPRLSIKESYIISSFVSGYMQGYVIAQKESHLSRMRAFIVLWFSRDPDSAKVHDF